MGNISITKDELNRCKRAVVVLAEIAKVSMGGKQAPLEMREDMTVLMKTLRRLEACVSEVSVLTKQEG